MKTINMNFIKKVTGLLMAVYIVANLVSCSFGSVEEETIIENPDESYTSNRTDQEPLNVMYFIPTDFVSEYESKENTIKTNLSEAMLFTQEWYKKQMELGGYPDKTFALFTRNSNTEVRIIPVYGSKASDQYTNNNEVKTEVESYFQNNPDEAGGAHTLVLSDHDAGFPMDAAGKMGFASSPDDFAMENTGQTIDGLQLLTSEKYGQLLHELAHALNVPHVAHRASDSPYRSMMGGGGMNRWNAGGWEDEVKFLASSLAILDVCAAFNKTNNGVDYYAVEPDVEMVSYAVKKNNDILATEATFTFTSDIPPKYLFVGMDAEPTGTNSDYDKIAFTTTVTATGNTNEYKAELEMPYSEFFNGYSNYGIKTDNNIEFSVNVLTENGFREIPLVYTFTISSANSPEPDDNINKEIFALSDRSTWSATANTTTYDAVTYGAATMLDSDFSTFWFSAWPTPSASDTPHIINVDMGEENTFSGIYLHSLRTPNPQFRPKHVLVEVSSDDIGFTIAADYTEPSENQEVKVFFDNEQTARYIRITVDEVYTSNGVENLVINELDIIVD